MGLSTAVLVFSTLWMSVHNHGRKIHIFLWIPVDTWKTPPKSAFLAADQLLSRDRCA